jgi:hypothetical protein
MIVYDDNVYICLAMISIISWPFLVNLSCRLQTLNVASRGRHRKVSCSKNVGVDPTEDCKGNNAGGWKTPLPDLSRRSEKRPADLGTKRRGFREENDRAPERPRSPPRQCRLLQTRANANETPKHILSLVVMPTKEPSYIQACARCNSKKIKCLVREGGGACEQCSALDVECVYVAVIDRVKIPCD